MDEVYNPLDRVNLAKNVAGTFLESKVHPLPPEEKFRGAGIYAIYYAGNFDAYEKINTLNDADTGNFDYPIYVGKAVPRGRRKGIRGLENYRGRALYNRLNRHKRIIEAVENLSLDDFYCRYLVVDDIWIPLAETLLIKKYKPLWNQCIDGFGNNDPGSRRYSAAVPDWHVLHPGVEWAGRMTGEKTPVEELMEKIDTFVKSLGEASEE